MRRLGLALLWLAACGSSEPAPPGPVDVVREAASVTEARRLYPRAYDLQTQVISKTCSPNPGVCHNSNNYPNLRTPGQLLAAIDAPCNIELPDPTQGWDACERAADRVSVGDFSSLIAWTERQAPGRWRLGLKDAPAMTLTERPQIVGQSGEVVLAPIPEWNVTVALVRGQHEAELSIEPLDAFVHDLLDRAMGAVVGGDPNRNGVFGAELAIGARGRLVFSGDVARSYLWGRVTATVPGSRMPLANRPLSNAAYAALACWIEGLDPAASADPERAIDYDNCQYAKAPSDPAIP